MRAHNSGMWTTMLSSQWHVAMRLHSALCPVMNVSAHNPFSLSHCYGLPTQLTARALALGVTTGVTATSSSQPCY